MRIFASSLARQTPALVGLWIVLQATTIAAQQADSELSRAIELISSERMLADVRTLSSPSFNGRQTGTEDDLRSA
ncbi:MAG: hypothetical protein LDL14_09560, partial [Nitrospira sp.]|nr:hypothetical protein [Nitrospira sp.]